MRTQVAIVGAGPAGLMLAHLLHLRGHRLGRPRGARPRVRRAARPCGRARAGHRRPARPRSGVGERLQREGIVHHGIELRFEGRGPPHPAERAHRRARITVYGQQEVVKDLIAARLASGRPLLFEAADVALHDLESDRPSVRFRHEGAAQELELRRHRRLRRLPRRLPRQRSRPACSRATSASIRSRWLGILAAVAPSTDELIYASHERGFALHSLRSPEVSRLYLQCAPDEDLGELAGRAHLGGAADAPRAATGWTLQRGPGPREGRHRHAQLRGRADAARAAVPCRRRRAHRAADRRQGAEPRRRRRPRPRRGAGATGTGPASRRCSTATPRPACGGSGAPSTSRGG